LGLLLELSLALGLLPLIVIAAAAVGGSVVAIAWTIPEIVRIFWRTGGEYNGTDWKTY